MGTPSRGISAYRSGPIVVISRGRKPDRAERPDAVARGSPLRPEQDRDAASPHCPIEAASAIAPREWTQGGWIMTKKLAWIVLLAAAAAGGCLTGSGAVRGASGGDIPGASPPAAHAGR